MFNGITVKTVNNLKTIKQYNTKLTTGRPAFAGSPLPSYLLSRARLANRYSMCLPKYIDRIQSYLTPKLYDRPRENARKKNNNYFF